MDMDTEMDLVDLRRSGEEQIELEPSEGSLHFLQKVYRNPSQPMPTRMRAAIECLPFENAKLSAIAMTQMNGRDFGQMLDNAILRSERVRPKLISPPMKTVSGPSPETVSDEHIKRSFPVLRRRPI